MKTRPGSALAELLTAMVLLGLIAVACGTLIHSQTGLVRMVSERTAGNEALRTARLLLRAEFRDIDSADVRAIGPDSLAARVFRGWAVVCAIEADVAVLLYRGIRAPDAEKDSLLLVGEETALAFSPAAPPSACPTGPEERLVPVRTSARLRLHSVVLLFESGAYHLANNALRYRRGLEGRQPITDELLDSGSGFEAEPQLRGIRIRLRARDLHGAVRSADTRIGFTNQAP